MTIAQTLGRRSGSASSIRVRHPGACRRCSGVCATGRLVRSYPLVALLPLFAIVGGWMLLLTPHGDHPAAHKLPCIMR